jgi:hypothetical protein
MMRSLSIVWATLAVAAPFAHSAGTSAPAACAGRAPRAVRLTRLAGPHVRLSWRAPGGTPTPSAYRVLRAGRTVGQTTGTSMVLAVVLGRRTTFTVQARYASAPAVCAAHLASRLALRPPARVRGLHVIAQTASGAHIGWSRARAGDAPIAGYRVYRDGARAATR